jgi:hypothetical protein
MLAKEDTHRENLEKIRRIKEVTQVCIAVEIGERQVAFAGDSMWIHRA